MPDPPYDEKLQMVKEGEMYTELLRDDTSNTFMTQGETTKAMYNDSIYEDKDRLYLYIGDEFGFLKMWDLDPVLERAGIKHVKSYRSTKTSFNPFRQEKVDCTDYAHQLRITHMTGELP